VLCCGQVGMVAPTDAAKRLGGPLHGVLGVAWRYDLGCLLFFEQVDTLNHHE